MTSISSSAYVGQTGSNLGYEHDVQWERYQKKQAQLGYTDYKSSLFLGGIDGNAVLQSVEDTIEGNQNGGDGISGNLLSWRSYVESNNEPDNFIFGSNDSNIFTNVNFNSSSYSVMNEQGFSEMLINADWSNGKPYDVYDMGQNRIDFTEFVFNQDGDQANIVFDLNEIDDFGWGVGTFTYREVDTEYWDGLCMNPDDPESVSAYDSLSRMIKAQNQWLTPDDKELLSEFEVGSTEYWDAFLALAQDRLDQGNGMPTLET